MHLAIDKRRHFQTHNFTAINVFLIFLDILPSKLICSYMGNWFINYFQTYISFSLVIITIKKIIIITLEGVYVLENVLFVLDSLWQYNESLHSKIPIENYILLSNYCNILHI